MGSPETVVSFEQSILDHLRSRKWRAGDRIPTERDFCSATGLSRSAVRRVLAGLKRRGLITQTVGSGTYVSDDIVDALGQMAAAAVAHTASPSELMGARLALEPSIVELVVANANSVDFARMDECCGKAEASTTLEEFERWDSLLHHVIADASHNAMIMSVFALMNQARQDAEWGMLKRRSATPERRLEYQSEHRSLVDALKLRDAARAREICLAHLLHVRHNMLGH